MISFKQDKEFVELPKKLNVAPSRFEETIPNEDFHFYRFFVSDEPEIEMIKTELVKDIVEDIDEPHEISQELIEEDIPDEIVVIESTAPPKQPIDYFTEMMETPDFKHASFIDIKVWALLHTHFRTGIDYADLLTIKNKDIDFSNDTLIIHPKSGQNIYFPLHSHLKECLIKYIERRKGKPEDYFFCNEQGQELSLMACHYQIQKMLLSYNLNKLNNSELNKFYRELF